MTGTFEKKIGGDIEKERGVHRQIKSKEFRGGNWKIMGNVGEENRQRNWGGGLEAEQMKYLEEKWRTKKLWEKIRGANRRTNWGGGSEAEKLSIFMENEKIILW